MEAKIILDSVSDEGIRLTTFHLRYWRSIHAELMTHRDFSRNARSSRAVPSRILLTEPIFVPEFGMNQPGMQSDGKPLMPGLQSRWSKEWSGLAELCRKQVEKWQAEGMHKQWANRPLEWFGWIDVLVTATRYENFWALRISEYAQPEFDALANLMKQLIDLSNPRLLLPGQWHLPYVSPAEERERGLETSKMLSAARCARLSYKPFDGSDSLEREQARYDMLVNSKPVHASPVEHQATPDRPVDYGGVVKGGQEWEKPHLHGNYHGWIQNRKLIPDEVVR